MTASCCPRGFWTGETDAGRLDDWLEEMTEPGVSDQILCCSTGSIDTDSDCENSTWMTDRIWKRDSSNLSSLPSANTDSSKSVVFGAAADCGHSCKWSSCECEGSGAQSPCMVAPASGVVLHQSASADTHIYSPVHRLPALATTVTVQHKLVMYNYIRLIQNSPSRCPSQQPAMHTRGLQHQTLLQYPEPYPNKTYCRWGTTTNAPHLLHVFFHAHTHSKIELLHTNRSVPPPPPPPPHTHTTWMKKTKTNKTPATQWITQQQKWEKNLWKIIYSMLWCAEA